MWLSIYIYDMTWRSVSKTVPDNQEPSSSLLSLENPSEASSVQTYNQQKAMGQDAALGTK